MAQGNIYVFNNFKEQLLLGALGNLTSVSVKITLHTATPSLDGAANWAAVSANEYTTAAGYTSDTKTLANKSVTQDDTNDRALWDADNVTWTALGPLTPATPTSAILRVDDANDFLICYVELGVTATNGGDYTIAWSTSPSAIISLT